MLTQETLKSLLHYNPETGIFTKPAYIGSQGRHFGGQVRGHTRKDGYICIHINGKSHLSHRLAWLYVHGYTPDFFIDHIDHVKSNNSIANLRECSRAENYQNQIKPKSHNKSSQYLGVTFDKKNNKFRAQIGLNGKNIKLGRFNTEEEAYQAYVAKKNEIHPFSTLNLIP